MGVNRPGSEDLGLFCSGYVTDFVCVRGDGCILGYPRKAGRLG